MSAGLAGAILYFLGAISIIPAVILAGYILLKEENDWLKYSGSKNGNDCSDIWSNKYRIKLH